MTNSQEEKQQYLPGIDMSVELSKPKTRVFRVTRIVTMTADILIEVPIHVTEDDITDLIHNDLTFAEEIEWRTDINEMEILNEDYDILSVADKKATRRCGMDSDDWVEVLTDCGLLK